MAAKKKIALNDTQRTRLNVQILETDLRRKQAEAEKQERLLAVLDATYLPRESVEQSCRTIARVCNQFFRSVRSELPPLLEGMTAPQIEAALIPWVQNWEAKLEDSQSDLWKEAQRAVQAELRGDFKKVAQQNRVKDANARAARKL